VNCVSNFITANYSTHFAYNCMLIATDLWVVSSSMANKVATISREISETSDSFSRSRCTDTTSVFFRPLPSVAKDDNWLHHVFLSVCTHGTTRLLSLYGFPWSLIFDYFSKICRVNSCLIKTWQEFQVFYMKTYVRLWYLAVLFLEWLTKTMYVLYTVSVIKHRVSMYFMYLLFPQL
jgi:hypothetical protein